MSYFFPILVIASLIVSSFSKTRRFSVVMMLLIFLALITIYPGESLLAASEGINLWIFVVMPSLFPFFIISDLLISLKIPENIARLFAPIANLLFKTSGYGAYVFIMSIFSGYPSGAKITSELITSKKITSREGQKILTFSSTSGPLFIIGAVGAGMLKSTAAGYIIFISHILGAVINGILLKHFNKIDTTADQIIHKNIILNKNSPAGNILSNAIVNSLYTSGLIGGYIILFSVIIALLDKITFFSTLAKIIDVFLPNSISNFISILIKSSLEISNGCKIISSLSAENDLKLILISFIIAFSGFSIVGQVASIINRTKINLRYYILGKLSHGIISSLLCYVLLKFNFVKMTMSYSRSFNLFTYNTFIIQILLCIILLLNILSLVKSNFHIK